MRLAAPFPPHSARGKRIDELYITRTWQFLPGNILRNKLNARGTSGKQARCATTMRACSVVAALHPLPGIS